MQFHFKTLFGVGQVQRPAMSQRHAPRQAQTESGRAAGLGSAGMQALPQRILGIMRNDTLLAIPFFTLMGLILERSGMAEDLLDTIGQLFGPIRGGLAHCLRPPQALSLRQ